MLVESAAIGESCKAGNTSKRVWAKTIYNQHTKPKQQWLRMSREKAQVAGVENKSQTSEGSAMKGMVGATARLVLYSQSFSGRERSHKKKVNSRNGIDPMWANQSLPVYLSIALPVSVNKNTPFGWALALQSLSRNCSPAFDLVFLKLMFPCVFFSGGVFFFRHRYLSVSLSGSRSQSRTPSPRRPPPPLSAFGASPKGAPRGGRPPPACRGDRPRNGRGMLWRDMVRHAMIHVYYTHILHTYCRYIYLSMRVCTRRAPRYTRCAADVHLRTFACCAHHTHRNRAIGYVRQAHSTQRPGFRSIRPPDRNAGLASIEFRGSLRVFVMSGFGTFQSFHTCTHLSTYLFSDC